MTTNSILDSIKKMVGISADDDAYDIDVITFINSSFMTLTQLGGGPQEGGYQISSSGDEWTDYSSDPVELAASKTYVYLRTKLKFDPPTSATIVEAYNRSADELEWRIREHQADKVREGV